MKRPAPATTPEVYEPTRHSRVFTCRICDNQPARDWIAASLLLTHQDPKAQKQWPIRGLCREMRKRFGARFSESLMGRHLEQHEPNWQLGPHGEKRSA